MRLELWVRIYPDQIAINAHEPELTPQEIADGQSYWTQVGAAEIRRRRPRRRAGALARPGRNLWPPARGVDRVATDPDQSVAATGCARRRGRRAQPGADLP